MWTRVLLILLVGWTQLAWAGSSIDENHALRVDSKPYFPIGVFDVYPQEELAKAAALGFNTVEVPFKVMDRRFPDESQGVSAPCSRSFGSLGGCGSLSAIRRTLDTLAGVGAATDEGTTR